MAQQISTARKVGRAIKTIIKALVALALVVLVFIMNAVVPDMGMITRMANNMLGYQQGWTTPAGAEDVDAQYYKTRATSRRMRSPMRSTRSTMPSRAKATFCSRTTMP